MFILDSGLGYGLFRRLSCIIWSDYKAKPQEHSLIRYQFTWAMSLGHF